MNKRAWGLRQKTIFLLLTVGLVPFCIAAISGITFFVRGLKDSLGNNFYQVAQHTGERVDVILNREIKVIEAIAGSGSILREALAKSNSHYTGLTDSGIARQMRHMDKIWAEGGPEDSRIKSYFWNALAKRLRDIQSLEGLEYLEILVADAKGGLVASTAKTEKYCQADEEWWKRTFQSRPGEVYASDIYFDSSVKDHAVAICIPVRRDKDNRILGAIKAELSWRYLFNPLVSLQIGKTGHAYLMDDRGRLRIEKGNLAKDFKNASKHLHLQRIKNMLSSGEKWIVERCTHSGAPEIIAATVLLTESRLAAGSLGGGKWFVVLHQSEKEALAPVRRVAIVLSLAAVVICGAIILIGIHASRRLVSPILEMKGVAESIGAGDLGCRIKAHTGDELEDLADEINRMAEKLGSAHVFLEQQVAARTRDLRGERNFLNSVLKSLEDALIVLDRAGRVEMCSPSVESFFGYSPKELQDIRTLLRKICADNEKATEIESAFYADMASYYTITCSFVRKDGVLGWMKLSILLTEDRRYLVLNAHDITEKRKAYIQVAQARAELDQIFNAAGDGIRVVDKSFNVLRMNDAFLQLCGFPREEASSLKCYEAFPANACQSPDCPLNRILNGEDFVDSETVNFRRGGITKHCAITARPFRDSEGNVIGVVQAFKDLGKLKEMQSQLLQSEKLASIGQLAAGIAHEINNPVGFINSNLTTLDEYRRDLTDLINNYIQLEVSVGRTEHVAPGPDSMENRTPGAILREIAAFKERIDLDFVLADFEKVIIESREGTERVKKIVMDLKDFSHIDQAELMWADLNKGLESTLNIVWNEIKYKASVSKHYGNIPEVYCYPQQINQVFANILINAAQAIEDRGEIKISSEYLAGDPPVVEVRISDTGKGIHPENLPVIFDPFFTTKHMSQGTGLGLSVSYNIIKKHQGEIRAESQLGHGTTFVITLPVESQKG